MGKRVVDLETGEYYDIGEGSSIIVRTAKQKEYLRLSRELIKEDKKEVKVKYYARGNVRKRREDKWGKLYLSGVDAILGSGLKASEYKLLMYIIGNVGYNTGYVKVRRKPMTISVLNKEFGKQMDRTTISRGIEALVTKDLIGILNGVIIINPNVMQRGWKVEREIEGYFGTR